MHRNPQTNTYRQLKHAARTRIGKPSYILQRRHENPSLTWLLRLEELFQVAVFGWYRVDIT